MAINIRHQAGLELCAVVLEVSALKFLQPTRPSGLTSGLIFSYLRDYDSSNIFIDKESNFLLYKKKF
jgi:hypothetical protein